MIIHVNKEILQNAISNLEKNKQYIVIDKNMFSIKNIDTLLNIKTEYGTHMQNGLYDYSKFIFKYSNENIEISYRHASSLCQNFVEVSKIISDNEVSTLMEKSFNIALDRNLETRVPGFTTVREIDEIFYNEVLIYIASKINENDKDRTTDDFTSKFNLFKEKQEKEIQETCDLMNKLYDMLLKIKLENE